MDSEAFDGLQKRLAKLERRMAQLLGIALVATFVAIIALAVHFAGRKAASAPTRFTEYTQTVHYFTDARTAATCYEITGVGLSCVR